MDFLVDLHEHAKRYAYSERLSKIPDDELIREILPKHKHGIMKRILRFIKIYDQDEVDQFVPKMVAALRHFGVDWPDLDIVEKSIKADSLKETDVRGEFVRYLIAGIDDSLEYGTVKGALGDLHNLKERPEWPNVKTEVLGILAEHKGKILAYLHDPISSIFLRHLCTLLDAGVDWSEMQIVLSTRKKDIVRWLLDASKKQHTAYVKKVTDELIALNVNWPELGIILKSANAELNRPTELDEGDMSSSELDDLMRIEQNFNANQIYYALLLIDKNDFNVVKHPDIGYLLNDQQANIREFMLHRLERKDVFEFIRIADMIKSTRIGWTWPTELIEQKKPEVVKLLLSLVLNPYAESELVLDLSWMIGKLGIEWPELSIIEKSVRSDSKNA